MVASRISAIFPQPKEFSISMALERTLFVRLKTPIVLAVVPFDATETLMV